MKPPPRLSCIAVAGFVALTMLGGITSARASGRDNDATPSRIVSVNMCTDELLLRLASPARIASVTWLSQDARSANMASAALTHPANHGLAEEVMAYRPDLVLVGLYTTRTTVQLLRRMNIRIAELGVPRSIEAVRAQIRSVASVVGEPARGEALVEAMDRHLEQAAARASDPPLRAIVLRPNGITVGKGSLVNELIEHAGLVNLAATLGIDNYLQIPLEAVALQNADVLILSGDGADAPSLATEVLHHPIVAKLASRLKIVSMPSRLWTCAGPAIADAVDRLIDATRPAQRGAAP